MKKKVFRFKSIPADFQKFFSLVFFGCLILIFSASVFAQSTSVEFPTAVSTNEIKGTIQPRDLGDARLTSFYYTFNGAQGDIFINVSAANFTGDIDVFAAEGLRPLSKISFYGDSAVSETGRVVYLRKPEKLILRVQGRTPDDNPASFQIKFAGSFVAVEDTGANKELELPKIQPDETTGIRVNSVGTIIETKPQPEKKETIAESKNEETKVPAETAAEKPAKVIETDDLANKAEEKEKAPADSEAKETKTAEAVPAKRKTTAKAPRKTTIPKKTTAAKPVEKTAPPSTVAATTPDPMENVRLVVVMKNGEKLEFPMPEVFRFSMNNGVLTIITKDGKILRRPMVDVQKMTVE